MLRQVVEHTSRLKFDLYQKTDMNAPAAANATEAAPAAGVQPRPPLGTMTRDAFMMVTRHAARLLPRSRRQLERLCRGSPNDPTTRSLRDPNHAVHRYLDGDLASLRSKVTRLFHL
jgi:hypothetical protein